MRARSAPSNAVASSSRRSPAMTSQPAAARRRVTARPIPRRAPVTSTEGMPATVHGYRPRMSPKRGIFLAPFHEVADPRLLAELAHEAEAAGWDGFFLWDHIRYSPPDMDVSDPWVAMSAIAIATDRVRIGPLVTPVARRRPHKLARETVTLDHLSGGRLVLGVGLGGDNHGEFGDFGEE